LGATGNGTDVAVHFGHLNHAVLAVAHLSQLVGSIPISFGTASVTGDQLAFNLQ
jgi:hypothetical protein